MRKFFAMILVAGAFLAVSCGPSAEEKAAAEQARLDSIAAVEAAAEQARLDSIAAVEAAAAADTMMVETPAE
ncbi:MAG TPA: hypothetical protein P5550_09405 [Bacteroidales bacterium]|nr:hypothetical protein [Bacteroidales bacterium]HRZ77390.1 hypothetical protein [Bacteroidales bacterium]